MGQERDSRQSEAGGKSGQRPDLTHSLTYFPLGSTLRRSTENRERAEGPQDAAGGQLAANPAQEQTRDPSPKNTGSGRTREPGRAPHRVSELCLNTTPCHPHPRLSYNSRPACPWLLGSPREDTASLGSQVPLVSHTRQGTQGLRPWEPWKGGEGGFASGEYEFRGARGKTLKGRILRWSQGPGPYRTHTSALIIPPIAVKGFLKM